MAQVIIMTVSLIIFGLLLCLLKAFLWWLGRQERKKRQTRIILSKKFQIERPISIKIKTQHELFEGRARISNSSVSSSAKMYGATDRKSNSTETMDNMDVICSICLGAYKEGQQLFVLKCGHVYHEDCILTWFDQDIVCPICRKSMTGSDLDFVVQTLPCYDSYYKKTSYI